ncbi:MAG: PLP-dependent transferase [Rheinheimera sp.]|nr:PLP-dependent transferase [Rheinheimera sp.]
MRCGHRGEQVPYYGRRGTQTHFAFSDAVCELEGGAGCALYPSGAAAISGALLAFLKTGDHLLMVDAAYEPTRALCDKVLKPLGIETTYYDPLIGAGIAALVKPNTRVIYLESPCSLTMEVQDVPAICAVAQAHNIVTILDNTWASPILCQPFALGVDISIQAATKYICGHSDVMLGTASANAKHWPQLREHSYLLGYCASADDVYLAARGLRTLGVRLAQHQRNTLQSDRMAGTTAGNRDYPASGVAAASWSCFVSAGFFRQQRSVFFCAETRRFGRSHGLC